MKTIQIFRQNACLVAFNNSFSHFHLLVNVLIFHLFICTLKNIYITKANENTFRSEERIVRFQIIPIPWAMRTNAVCKLCVWVFEERYSIQFNSLIIISLGTFVFASENGKLSLPEWRRLYLLMYFIFDLSSWREDEWKIRRKEIQTGIIANLIMFCKCQIMTI